MTNQHLYNAANIRKKDIRFYLCFACFNYSLHQGIQTWNEENLAVGKDCEVVFFPPRVSLSRVQLVGNEQLIGIDRCSRILRILSGDGMFFCFQCRTSISKYTI